MTRAAAATILVGLGVAACGSSSPTGSGATATSAPGASAAPSSAAAGATQTKTITIQGFSFKPSPASAKVGDTITVANMDNTEHSLTANDGSFDTGKFSSGSKTIKLSKAGSVPYHCEVHNYMTGVIQVTG